ncbi:MAG: hypothetical protein MI919_38045, partial [Holophagales bacterium]|nr:hypothetical protein [Holophagales bacterium]
MTSSSPSDPTARSRAGGGSRETRSSDASSASWAFVCLAVFLLATAFTLGRPGLPRTLVEGEATAFSIAASLALDRDLRPDFGDLERLFRQYTFTAPVSIELAAPAATPTAALAGSDGSDGAQSDAMGADWRSARYDQPLAYPLLAAPLVALFGANGFYVLNVALFLGTLWMLARMVREKSAGESPEPALLLPAVGLILSAAFPYLFRLHPAWFHAFLLTASLAPLCWRSSRLRAGEAAAPGTGGRGSGTATARRHLSYSAVLAGVCLALAA